MALSSDTGGDILVGGIFAVVYLVQLLRKRVHPYAVSGFFALYAGVIVLDVLNSVIVSRCLLAVALVLFGLHLYQRFRRK